MEESSQGRCSFPSFLLPSSMPLCRKQHTHCKLVTAVVHAFFSNARRWSPAVWTRDFSPFELTGAGPVASPVYLYIFYYCCFVHVTLFRLKEQKEIQRSVLFSLKSQVSGMYLHCVCCCGDDADACFLQKSNNADAWFVEQLHTLAACHGEFAPACPAKMSRV